MSAAQELRVAGNLLRLLEHPPGLGLEVGLQYHFSAYGVWGYGLISSATGADAMALALRFLPLTFAFCGIAYHEEGELGVLGFGEPALADGTGQFLLERDMAAAAVLLREIGGGDFRVRAFTLTARALARGNSGATCRRCSVPRPPTAPRATACCSTARLVRPCRRPIRSRWRCASRCAAGCWKNGARASAPPRWCATTDSARAASRRRSTAWRSACTPARAP